MAGIADFLDSLIGGFDLICYALTIGCLFWTLFLFQPWKERIDSSNTLLLERTITLIYKGGFWLTGAQLFKIVLKIWLMTAILEKSPFPEFAETTQFIGGLTRATLAFIFASYVYHFLKLNPFSKSRWLIASLLAVPMIISGAWLVHGAGRFENQTLLMTLTLIHQVAAAAWIGGVFQLLNVWQFVKLNKLSTNYWRQLLKKFTILGAASVAVILMSGIPLALQYIDSWNGLMGSGYGNLLLVKITLLGIALYFANLNRYAAQNNDNYSLTFYVPHYIEAETFVLITLLFTAASLASQPPAIDIPNLTASWQDVLNTFAPQIPSLSSPTHTDLISGEAGRTAIIGQIPSIAATEWSNYNHNVAGIFLTTMSFFAMLSYLRYRVLQFCKFWSVGFIALGIFLFFRSDAETWPLGSIGFWDSTFNNGEVLQHRIATLLVFTLGVIELSSRVKPNYSQKLPFIFPILAALGGLMLLTHSHVGFQPKSAFLIQVGHTTMGVFSLILACGRWLELNLEGKKRAFSGFVSVAALFQIGLILMFYREPLY